MSFYVRLIRASDNVQLIDWRFTGSLNGFLQFFYSWFNQGFFADSRIEVTMECFGQKTEIIPVVQPSKSA